MTFFWLKTSFYLYLALHGQCLFLTDMFLYIYLQGFPRLLLRPNLSRWLLASLVSPPLPFLFTFFISFRILFDATNNCLMTLMLLVLCTCLFHWFFQHKMLALTVPKHETFGRVEYAVKSWREDREVTQKHQSTRLQSLKCIENWNTLKYFYWDFTSRFLASYTLTLSLGNMTFNDEVLCLKKLDLRRTTFWPPAIPQTSKSSRVLETMTLDLALSWHDDAGSVIPTRSQVFRSTNAWMCAKLVRETAIALWLYTAAEDLQNVKNQTPSPCPTVDCGWLS